MDFIMTVLVIPLGYLMSACYNVVKNYGLAIIFFTIISKVILLPLSIWVHKNSIKMIKMLPEINNVKANFFGDADRIADEQSKIFKRDKYNPLADIVPLVIQIVLLMGIIDVIYHPFNYLLHLENGIIQQLVDIIVKATGANPLESTIQLAVVSAVQGGAFTSEFSAIGAEVLNAIQGINFTFLGLHLADVPSLTGGVNILVPLVAAASSWLLCFTQNKSNVLQSEQSNWNKYGLMIFSIALSLYLGFFVPIGVALYWICGNLFAIVQMYLLNWAINPKRYIDYNALEKSREKLKELQEMGIKKKWYEKDPNAKREKADYKRFFSIANKHLVFYAYSSGFYKYFRNIIEYILANSNLTIRYVTSDPNDKIFDLAKQENKLNPYYIGEKRLITLMMKMDADMVVMTMPDLENMHIKRSYVRKDIEYIYTDHGIGSANLTLRTHALDHFDTVFCTGQYQIDELIALEKLYQTKKKKLLPVGYCLLDNMSMEYSKMDMKENSVKTILVAPSWQADNIMDSCLDELIDGLRGEGYRLIIRPHPQYVRIYQAKMQAILSKYSSKFDDMFAIETDFSSNVTVYTADLVITDWSNIGCEFSFTTGKPTLYIDTPMKVMNAEWQQIDVPPIDIELRNQIGRSLGLDKLKNIETVVGELITNKSKYQEQIQQAKNSIIFNHGRSGEVGGQYIIDTLREKIQQKKV